MARLPGDIEDVWSAPAMSGAEWLAAQRAQQKWDLADVALLSGERSLREALAQETDPTGLQERYAPRLDEMRQKAAEWIDEPQLRMQWLSQQSPRVAEHIAAVKQRADALEDERVIREVTAPLTLIEQTRRIGDQTKQVESEVSQSDRLDVLGDSPFADRTLAESRVDSEELYGWRRSLPAEFGKKKQKFSARVQEEGSAGNITAADFSSAKKGVDIQACLRQSSRTSFAVDYREVRLAMPRQNYEK